MTKLAINLSLAARIVAVVMLLGCGLNILASYYSLNELKVGGPVYQRVIQGKDLVADVLPPPEYLIEAFLEVNLARGDVAALDGHKQRLAKLRKDYDERHDYWARQTLEASVRDILLRESDTPARRFWSSRVRRFCSRACARRRRARVRWKVLSPW